MKFREYALIALILAFTVMNVVGGTQTNNSNLNVFLNEKVDKASLAPYTSAKMIRALGNSSIYQTLAKQTLYSANRQAAQVATNNAISQQALGNSSIYQTKIKQSQYSANRQVAQVTTSNTIASKFASSHVGTIVAGKYCKGTSGADFQCIDAAEVTTAAFSNRSSHDWNAINYIKDALGNNTGAIGNGTTNQIPYYASPGATLSAKDFQPGVEYVIPSGNTSTATRLANTPRRCTSPKVAAGIDSFGNATGCVSAGGTTDHAGLSNLDYAHSGHTGFQATFSNISCNVSAGYVLTKLSNGAFYCAKVSGGSGSGSGAVGNGITVSGNLLPEAVLDISGNTYFSNTTSQMVNHLTTPFSVPAGGSFEVNDKIGINDLSSFAYMQLAGFYDYFGNVFTEYRAWNYTLSRISEVYSEMAKSGVKHVRIVSTMPKYFNIQVAQSVVYYHGHWYKALSTHIGSNDKLPTDTTYWSLTTTPAVGWGNAWKVGIRYYKFDGSDPVVIDESLGWEAVDLAVKLARQYGMSVTLTLPRPPVEVDTYRVFNNWLNNYQIPVATFIANRYKNDADIISIEPASELNRLMRWYFSDITYADPFTDPMNPNWIIYQKTIYDTIKSVSNIRVILSNMQEESGWAGTKFHLLGAVTQLNTYDAGYGAGCINPGCVADSLGHTKFVQKFDDRISVNLYPNQYDYVVAPDFYSDSRLAEGEGRVQDLDAAVNYLRNTATPHRAGIQAEIGEFGLFWNVLGTLSFSNGSHSVVGSNTYFTSEFSSGDHFKILTGPGILGGGNIYTVNTVTDNTHMSIVETWPYTSTSFGLEVVNVEDEIQSAEALPWMFNYAKSDPLISYASFWTWGNSNRAKHINGHIVYPGAYAEPGTGLFNEDTKSFSLPGLALQALGDVGSRSISYGIKTGLSTQIPNLGKVGELIYSTDTGYMNIFTNSKGTLATVGEHLKSLEIKNSFPQAHIIADGDSYPYLRLSRINGITKPNSTAAWVLNSSGDAALQGFFGNNTMVFDGFDNPNIGFLFKKGMLHIGNSTYPSDKLLITSTYTEGLTFSGSGLDDMSSNQSYTGSSTADYYEIKPATLGVTDSFIWRKNGGSWSSEIDITKGSQNIIDGIAIVFKNATGHTGSELWRVSISTPDLFLVRDITNKAIFKITESGYVGIGTATPNTQLHVIGDAKVTGSISDGTTTYSNVSAISSAIAGKLGTSDQAADSAKLNNQSASYYQPASTAITSSNIGSQSVSYASTAGAAGNSSTANSAITISGSITKSQVSDFPYIPTSSDWVGAGSCTYGVSALNTGSSPTCLTSPSNTVTSSGGYSYPSTTTDIFKAVEFGTGTRSTAIAIPTLSSVGGGGSGSNWSPNQYFSVLCFDNASPPVPTTISNIIQDTLGSGWNRVITWSGTGSSCEVLTSSTAAFTSGKYKVGTSPMTWNDRNADATGDVGGGLPIFYDTTGPLYAKWGITVNKTTSGNCTIQPDGNSANSLRGDCSWSSGGSGTVTSITPGIGFISTTPITSTGIMDMDMQQVYNQIAGGTF